MKKTIKDVQVNNKTVILRCDLNVSIKNGKIIDDTRIKSSLTTINYLLENNAKVVILSHLGKVKTIEDKEKYSMKIIYEVLKETLKDKIIFIPYTKDPIIKESIDELNCGQCCLLENTRYEDLEGKKESGCDLELAKYWASLGDIFVNDAFGTIHRKHASNYGISTFLPSYAGFLVEKELKNLDVLDKPKRPFAVIMGGAKVSDKLEIINNLIDKVDKLFIGGAMAFTFLKASDINVGNSVVEEDMLDVCKELLVKYQNKIILPIDFYGSNKFSNEKEKELFFITDINDDFIGMDIGRQSIDTFINELDDVNTLFWNGPLGVYEFDKYKFGTEEVLKYVTNNIPVVILGGGDIVGCANDLGYKDKVTFASTGGGATLEYLANKDLPGLKNIK